MVDFREDVLEKLLSGSGKHTFFNLPTLFLSKVHVLIVDCRLLMTRKRILVRRSERYNPLKLPKNFFKFVVASCIFSEGARFTINKFKPPTEQSINGHSFYPFFADNFQWEAMILTLTLSFIDLHAVHKHLFLFLLEHYNLFIG